MPESTTSTPGPLPVIHRRRRITSRGLAFGCALLVVLGLCAISYEVVAHSRYKVVGDVDPTSGCRLDYTVSSRYRKSDPGVFAPFVCCFFKRTPLPPAVQWVFTGIFRKSALPAYTGIYADVPFDFRDSNSRVKIGEEGYPFLDDLHLPGSNVREAHLLVANCHTTLVTDRQGTPVAPRMDRNLLIKPNNQQVVFVFQGWEDINDTDVLNEMIKIRESIRITKVK